MKRTPWLAQAFASGTRGAEIGSSGSISYRLLSLNPFFERLEMLTEHVELLQYDCDSLLGGDSIPQRD